MEICFPAPEELLPASLQRGELQTPLPGIRACRRITRNAAIPEGVEEDCGRVSVADQTPVIPNGTVRSELLDQDERMGAGEICAFKGIIQA
jgi:hypothetical protein